MWPNPLEIADLVAFAEEILNGKLHFCAERGNLYLFQCYESTFQNTKEYSAPS